MKEINKFMLYASNYKMKLYCLDNSDLDIYAPECLESTNCPHHLASKFHDLAKKLNDGTLAFLRLWHKFDDDNKKEVINWINKNY